MPSLNRFLQIQRLLVSIKRAYYTRFWGMNIHPTCVFSLSARLDKTHPAGVHIGAETYVAFEAAILTHDMPRRLYTHTRIGKRCFIGARSIILPGVEIGDGCIIGSGSIVTKSIPSGCVAVGNPARIIQRDLVVGPFGQIAKAVAAEHARKANATAGL